MSNPCLEFLTTSERGFMWVGHHIYESNSIQANHLLKVNEPVLIAIDVVTGNAEICPV